MKALTIPQALAERAIAKDDLEFWANKEVAPVLRKAREALNAATTARKTADTLGTGAYVEIWRSEAMPTDGTWYVRAEVQGVASSGAAQQAVYFMRAAFVSAATTVSQLGATSSDAFESAAAINARFAIDATNRQIYLEVRDDATSPMRFVAVVGVMEANAA